MLLEDSGPGSYVENEIELYKTKSEEITNKKTEIMNKQEQIIKDIETRYEEQSVQPFLDAYQIKFQGKGIINNL